jgi:hypothetical protein
VQKKAVFSGGLTRSVSKKGGGRLTPREETLATISPDLEDLVKKKPVFGGGLTRSVTKRGKVEAGTEAGTEAGVGEEISFKLKLAKGFAAGMLEMKGDDSDDSQSDANASSASASSASSDDTDSVTDTDDTDDTDDSGLSGLSSSSSRSEDGSDDGGSSGEDTDRDALLSESDDSSRGMGSDIARNLGFDVMGGSGDEGGEGGVSLDDMLLEFAREKAKFRKGATSGGSGGGGKDEDGESKGAGREGGDNDGSGWDADHRGLVSSAIRIPLQDEEGGALRQAVPLRFSELSIILGRNGEWRSAQRVAEKFCHTAGVDPLQV